MRVAVPGRERQRRIVRRHPQGDFRWVPLADADGGGQVLAHEHHRRRGHPLPLPRLESDQWKLFFCLMAVLAVMMRGSAARGPCVGVYVHAWVYEGGHLVW